MDPRIVKEETISEYESSERCLIAENWSSPNVSIARATVRPGVTTALHYLKEVDEIYVIAKGKGMVKIGGLEPTQVGSGDTVIIPAGTPQQITNIGRGNLVFYCVCTPRFTRECFIGEN